MVTPKRNVTPVAAALQSSPCRPHLAAMHLLSVSVDLPVLDIPSKQNPVIRGFCVWLPSLNTEFLRFVRVGECRRFLGLLRQSTQNYGGFKQQKFILSRFWRPDVQDDGVGRAWLSVTAAVGSLSHAFLFASGAAGWRSLMSWACRGIAPHCVCTSSSRHVGLSLCPEHSFL